MRGEGRVAIGAAVVSDDGGREQEVLYYNALEYIIYILYIQRDSHSCIA
jgi:hypothetical protein